MFCPNCGAQIPDDSIFCDKCGCRIEGESFKQQDAFFSDEIKSGGSGTMSFIVIGLIIAAVAGAGVFYLWKTGVLGDGAVHEVVESTAELVAESGTLPEITTEPTEEAHDPENDTVTEQAADPEIESETQSSEELMEEPVSLPYSDTLGVPEATDFAWIPDVQTGDLTGRFLGNDELVGKWKGEIIYEAGIWELVYITIGTDGKITMEPYRINYGEGWDDEADSEPYLFDGEFDVSGINAAGNYGSVSLYTFLESLEAQYGVGTFTVNNSDSAKVYMVRP